MNVLFTGNLCAGLTTLAVFGPRRIARELRQTQAGQWWLVAANVGLAIAILFAYLLLRELPGPAQIIGGVVIAAGMVVARLGARKPPPEMGDGRLAAQ